MENPSYEALRKMKTELFVHKETKDILNMYDQWAEKYEDDIEAIGYKIHDESAEVLLRHLPQDNVKNSTVLDVLCGTGLVGMYLRQRGFTGTLHGIDGSRGMIARAESKKVYQTITQQHLEPGGESIFGGKLAEFNGVTCVGGFFGGHLDPKMLPELAKVLKPGGYLVYTARDSDDNDAYRLPLETEAKLLVDTGILEEVELVKTSYCVNWNVEGEGYADPASKELTPTPVWIYCYQKLEKK